MLPLPRQSDGGTPHLLLVFGSNLRITGNAWEKGRLVCGEGGYSLIGTESQNKRASVDPPSWARELRAARQAAGLTYAALARRTGLSRATLHRLEWPPIRWRPTHAVATAMCTSLEIPPGTASALRGVCRPEPSPLARRRRAAGQTQRQVAAALGVSQSTYQRYETGQRLVPARLAERLEKVIPSTGLQNRRPHATRA